jgi:hypothetical protein
MYKVYWTEDDGKAHGLEFDDMMEALAVTQSLRDVHYRRFVTMVSENPDNVTKMGVSDAPEGYSWKKRRI